MSTRIEYLNKARACAEAAEKVLNPAEQVALLKVSAWYVTLADYFAAGRDRGMVHEEDERLVADLASR